ncbi:hypothetical protein B0J11DRAFT_517192 [Dendryphion nanum]|uniref:ABM domain-containing protein n=1 Tax=Dendryphion nanum TaxID=256645 RepID=A0A9P9ED25_9PLEO|nr:hypothetical protein B0J11DRAFT_517192 [Dendryphion nanum]
MAPLLTTARLVLKDKASRDKALAAFHTIVEFSRVNEPDVTRYIVTVPLDDVAQNEIYMIEEYASPDASAAHLQTPPVQALIALFTTGDVLAAPPEVHNSTVAAAKSPAVPPSVSDKLAVILADVEYKSGTIKQALEGWKNVVDYAKTQDQGVHVYVVGEEDTGKQVRTVEIFDSWEFVKGTYLKAGVVQESRERDKAFRVGDLRAVTVKIVDGFLGREKGASKL